MRIAIVGSRSFARLELIESYVKGLSSDAVIVSGGAPGVDSAAAGAAQAAGRAVMVLEADWQQHGRSAGPMRNAQIVANADRIVAFWNGRSRGTLNTVALAVEAGLPVEIYDESGDPVPLDRALATARRLGVYASIEAAGRRAADTKQSS
jgi:predicted Rossmann fold nucleotide-binding protein DprA/Smf involved in DNA uptake